MYDSLLNIVTVSAEQRHSRGSQSPTVALKFRVEDRIECMQSHKVKYNYRDDYELALPIPLEAAINKGMHFVPWHYGIICKSLLYAYMHPLFCLIGIYILWLFIAHFRLKE